MPRPKASVTPNELIEAAPSIIKPAIIINGDPHPLQTLEAKGKMPVIRTVGLFKIGETSEPYVSCVVLSQGGKVIEIEVSAMTAKAIAYDDLKTRVVNMFMDDAEYMS